MVGRAWWGTILHVEDRVLALGEIAWDVLHRIVRDLLARKVGGHLVEASLERIEFALPLALRGAEADPRRFAESLAAAIDAVLDDLVLQAASFRPGHAFCHRCASAACEHSEPPSCRHVFVGYAPTGMPRWEDFAQHCLAIRHPDVDLLYAAPPAFVTLVQDAAPLRSALLPAFAVGSYELLGQLSAGFFPVRTRAEEGRGVLALTFQVALSQSASGRPRYGLNILGRTPAGEDLGMLWERHAELPWRRSVRWAQSALASLERTGGRDGGRRSAEISAVQRDQRVAGILRGMARRLERDLRARARRTEHAQDRHEAGDRPTRMAVTDVRAASPEAVLVDERSGTLVVLGDRGRTHFFTAEGRLVSSVRYSREAIERKRKLGLWRDASAEEAETLRVRIQEQDRQV